MLRIEKARNAIRYAVNKAAADYELPGFIIDLVINAVLQEELQQRMSLLSEQLELQEEEEAKDGKHSATPSENS